MASWWPLLALCLVLIAGCGASGASIAASRASVASPAHEGASLPWIAQHARRGKLASASVGCLAAPAVAPGTSATRMMSSAGQRRSYRLHAPSGYMAGKATPLVLAFHGDGGDGASLESYTGLTALADKHGFLVAYPNGLPAANGWTAWGGVGRDMPNVDDVRFVSDLLDTLEASYCVDPRRIYAVGFSRGGGMTALLACRLSGRIAAVAPVSGSFFGATEASCSPGRPIPILDFHGDADEVVPCQGGGGEGFLAVPTWLAGWAARDGCAAGPQPLSRGQGLAAERWTGCAGAATVVHCRIEGAGHAWPGAAGGPQVVNAGAVAWSFFQAHPLM
jgi:polyhydroxybutyrate depolymerase